MDTVSLVITGLSLVIAAVSATVAWRVVRADRQRTAARVAALAAAAGIGRPRAADLKAPDPTVAAGLDGLDDFLPATPSVSAAASRTAAADTVLVDGGAIFARPAVDSGSAGRQLRLLTAAAIVGLLAVGGGGVMFLSGRTPGAARPAPRTPLELVTLSHARTDGVLSVTGVVRNPAAGSAVDRVDAQVRVFDAAGIMIATRTARLDVAPLAPGQDAPFVVSLGEATTAARYRVSFTTDGTMLPHVDRRTNLPAAVTADAR
jgi:hypothetical protein